MGLSVVYHSHTHPREHCVHVQAPAFILSLAHTHTHTPPRALRVFQAPTHILSLAHTHTLTHCARKCRHENQTAVLEGLRSTAVRGSYAPSLLSRSDNSTQLCGV